MNTSTNNQTNPEVLTDQEADVSLIQQVLDGNINAYESIMRRHNQRLFRLARSIVSNDAEAMDIVQETHVTAFKRLQTLQDPKAFATWLARIAKNEALMWLRKDRRSITMEEEKLESVIEISSLSNHPKQPDNELANQQIKKLIEENIDKLPENFRSVFMLRAIEQCSVRETSEILEIPESTVKTRLHRANTLLQKQLNQHIEKVGLCVHEFAGARCDLIVRNVMRRISDIS